MTVATNTVRFLYNQNDLTNNNLNSLTFIFGSPNIIPCVESHLINRENNTFRYNCGCTNIDRDNNAGNNNIAERHKRNDHTAKAGDPFYTTENNEA